MGFQIQAAETDATPPPQTPKNPDEMSEVDRRWKRVVTSLRVVHMHAMTGALIHHLEEMRTKHEEEARRAYEKAAGSKITSKPKNKAKAKSKNLTAPLHTYRGKPLSRSMTQQWIYAPDLCPHKDEWVVTRGNKDELWFTCLKCGSLWERLETPYLPTGDALTIPLVAPGRTDQGVITSEELARMQGLPPGQPPVAIISVGSSGGSSALNAVPTGCAPKGIRKTTRDTKRKTDDFTMVGLSPLGQKAFARDQEMIHEDMMHDQAVQRMMTLAKDQAEVAAVIEIVQHMDP